MRAKQFINEVPLPPDWDPQKMSSRQTFKARRDYALDRAKRLGGGSSRVAVIIDYEGRPTALKVAINKKGLEQNDAEIDILKDGYAGSLPIVIPLIDYDKANDRPLWLQTEIAKKVKEPILLKLLHTPSLRLLLNKARNLVKQNYRFDMDDEKIKQEYFQSSNDRWKPTEQDYEIFETYATEIAQLLSSTTLQSSDLGVSSNWGVYNNRPVIIDLGFTTEVAPFYGIKV